MTVDQLPFHEWVLPDGNSWTQFYHTETGYLIRFPGLADFQISADGLQVTCTPTPVTTKETVEHLYLNQVLPLALSKTGKLALHASVVEINNSAVAFIAKSGRGKSTLAASFSTNGYRFLTDDGLLINKTNTEYLALPNHPSIRLWDDSCEALIPESGNCSSAVAYTSKVRILANEKISFCEQPCPLKFLYFLGEGNTDSVCISHISGHDALIEMVRHSFLLDVEAREMLSRHFNDLSALARKPIFFKLDFPRQYDSLSEVRKTVVNHVLSGLPG